MAMRQGMSNETEVDNFEEHPEVVDSSHYEVANPVISYLIGVYLIIIGE